VKLTVEGSHAMLVWNFVFCDNDSDCNDSHVLLTDVIDILPHLSTVFFRYFAPVVYGFLKIFCPSCLHFFPVWIKYGTGDVHKTVLHYYEFCENWCSDRCTEGRKYISVSASYYSSMGEIQYLRTAHDAADRL
jgi:hypothetical protein